MLAVAPRPAVRLVGLAKRVGPTTAVNEVSLDVPRGSMYGIAGPNGAAKTTTFRMCTGPLEPDAGHVLVGGSDVWADPIGAKARVGVLPADVELLASARRCAT